MRMARRLAPLVALALAGVGAGCAELDPRPGPIRAMEPRPNPSPIATPVLAPGATTQERLRRNPWLAGFWEELTPAQRRQVESRMRRGKPPLAANRREVQAAWDTMGLEQRDALLTGLPVRPPPTAAAPLRPATAQDAPPGRSGGG
jgi:hypothetical protein